MLEPLLFLLFINDLDRFISGVILDMLQLSKMYYYRYNFKLVICNYSYLFTVFIIKHWQQSRQLQLCLQLMKIKCEVIQKTTSFQFFNQEILCWFGHWFLMIFSLNIRYRSRFFFEYLTTEIKYSSMSTCLLQTSSGQLVILSNCQ